MSDRDWNPEADILEIPPYPEEWEPAQRVSAYWYALYHTGMPFDTQGWFAVWKLAQRQHERVSEIRKGTD